LTQPDQSHIRDQEILVISIYQDSSEQKNDLLKEEVDEPKHLWIAGSRSYGNPAARGHGRIGIEAENRLAGTAHVEAISGDVLNVGGIVFHELRLDLKLTLLILRGGNLKLQLGQLCLVLLLRVEHRQEEKANDRESPDDDRPLNNGEKSRPDIPSALSFERDAGWVKESGAGHGY